MSDGPCCAHLHVDLAAVTVERDELRERLRPRDCATDPLPDDERVLMYDSQSWVSGAVFAGKWHNDWSSYEARPTHWLPLPPAPKEEGNG